MYTRIAAWIFATVAAAFVCLAASPAFTQGRPSLELLTQELCNKAERDGDSYRPRVCEPQCGCGFAPLPTEYYAQNLDCQETQPGTFVVSGEGTFFGLCKPLFGGPGAGCYVGYASCETDADCLVPGYPDCAWVDAFPPAPPISACVSTTGECTSDADCPIVPANHSRSLTGVGPITDSGSATCVLDLLYPFEEQPGPISSVDANECLEQLLAVHGLDCGHRCGNGLLDPGETCDDSNETPGDGCDASCQTE